MSLSNEERDAIVFYRMQKAIDTFNEAQGISQLGYWNAVVNRLYYSCYYITSALLIKNGHTAQTHGGVIRLFGLNFVLKGVVPPELSRFYSKLFELRQTGDYDDLYNMTEDEVKPLIEVASTYLEFINVLLTKNDIDPENL
jgi:uncharacterized protein (UPF0332 family)